MIRIDDWPTGVLPIIPNHIEKFSQILNEFQKRKLEYILGVVPALININDIEYLKQLKYCKIALHGWDHNFYEWDGKNNFEYPTEEEIYNGLNILKSIGTVDHYIPPFNNIDNNTLSALIKNNVKFVHSHCGVEDSIDGINIVPRLYGRSTKIITEVMKEIHQDDTITLHITWEQIEKDKLGKNWKLPQILDILLKEGIN